jgi:hypothetical protein
MPITVFSINTIAADIFVGVPRRILIIQKNKGKAVTFGMEKNKRSYQNNDSSVTDRKQV